MSSPAKVHPRVSLKANLTLRVRKDALRSARTLAAQQGLSLSEFFERLAEEKGGQAAANERRKRKLLQIAERGLALGGSYASDKEMYGR